MKKFLITLVALSFATLTAFATIHIARERIEQCPVCRHAYSSEDIEVLQDGYVHTCQYCGTVTESSNDDSEE